MKILNIRFKNLNSLVGGWEIDLTTPDFEADGIFAITGPTGAGKSTILDAICLALYGRTPRLNKITKAENEIMSRQTGDCFAELTFATQTGQYRCNWNQRRARGRSDGELQQPRHEIVEDASGKVLASGIRDVADKVISVTGMDFERFTRSMLLAQGNFAAFLQAAPDERAPILEQITGTEIYSKISIQVHERHRQECTKLEVLRAEIAGITILEAEQENALIEAQGCKEKEDADLSMKVAATSQAITWLKTVNDLSKEIKQLDEDTSKLNEEIGNFQAKRKVLHRASNAESLNAQHATLQATRKQQLNDQAELADREKSLPALEKASQAAEEALKVAEGQTLQARAESQAAMPILQKVRELDQRLADQKKEIAGGKLICQQAAEEIDKNKKSLRNEEEKLSEAQKALTIVEASLKKHASDEWLVGELAAVKEKLNGLNAKQEESKQKKAELEQAKKKLTRTTKGLATYQKQVQDKEKELNENEKQVEQGKNILKELLAGRLLREHRAELNALLRELSLRQTIFDLNELRAHLEDGKPCPLCGALEHPFAEGNTPQLSQTEGEIAALEKLIAAAETQEEAIERLAGAKEAASQALHTAKMRKLEAENEKKAAENTLAEINLAVIQMQENFDKQRQALISELQPLGIDEVPENNIMAPLEHLRQRLQKWQGWKAKKEELEKRIAVIDGEIKKFSALLENQSSALAEKQNHLVVLEESHEEIKTARKELFGDKKSEVEEARLSQTLAAAEQSEKTTREQSSKLQQELLTAKSHLQSLNKRLAQQQPELETQEADFSAALATLQFADEKEFCAALLSSEEKNTLIAAAKKLDARQAELKTLHQDRSNRLADEKSKEITDKSLPELEPLLEESETVLKQLRDEIADIKSKLKENNAAKERIKEKQNIIEEQNEELQNWSNLHQLIGSADGKKYRVFAQGLTFELLISYANQQLQTMSDRYLLLRDQSEALELKIIDSYQAGEIRSTKNLSGGESFIVSLALALGLSQMSSENIRVDSLFLDEGFGTLDEDALETALETLASLRQNDKMIAIISHVGNIKERISTQIQVIPGSGGRSRLAGNGCQYINPA